MSIQFLDSSEKNEDVKLDVNLRPRSINEYVGQSKIKSNLEILLGAAKKRKESLEHILLYGASGLGKTTLAYIIAKEMGANIKVTSGPAIERVGDLGSILTNLADGDILFVDEAHRLNKMIEEVLYPAMEDYKLDIVIGKGPSARTIQLDLPRFTLVAATTRAGLLSAPLRSRFGVVYHLDFYNNKEMEQIIWRSAKILGVSVNSGAAEFISLCSRSTPRVANRLLKRVRDYAQVKSNGNINEEIARQAFNMLGVDHMGLESGDRKILRILIDKFDGGPAGIQSLAAASGEEIDTIEDFYEPYLMQIGFVVRTPRGRMANKSAYRHLGYEYNKDGGLL